VTIFFNTKKFCQLQAIEYVLYTLADFGFYTVDVELIPDEYAFIQNALVVAVEHLQNPEVRCSNCDIFVLIQQPNEHEISPFFVCTCSLLLFAVCCLF
jgi:hypothetical protein